MEHNEHIKHLYRKYLDNRITDSEKAELYAFFAEANDEVVGEVIDSYLHGNHEIPDLSHLSEVTGRVFLRVQQAVTYRRRRFSWLPYAAAVVLVLAVGLFFLNKSIRNREQGLVMAEIQPGGNRATLTLADGRTVDLSSEQTGIIVGDEITYVDGSGILSPEVGKSERPEDNRHAGLTTNDLRLTTPKGGTYQVILPDGSKVWLNAASTLEYPARFSGNIREVKISGEAFFEVAEDRSRPFKVLTRNQVVDVLGTSFNINSYPEEAVVKTTLISGAARVSVARTGSPGKTKHDTGLTLAPGEETVLTKTGTIKKQQADVESAISWKEGLFVFSGVPFDVIMRQIGRWYNVDIIYETGIPEVFFRGEMRRSMELSVLLEFLRDSGIRFRVEEGRRLIITSDG